MRRNQRLGARVLCSSIVVALLTMTAGITTVGVASAGGGVKGDYLFQDTLADGPDTPDFQTIGSGTAFATETVDGVQRRVLTWVEDSGLSLNPMSQFNSNSFTMVLLVRLQNVNGYRRILDFKQVDGAPGQYGLYVSDGTLTFVKANYSYGPVSISPNTWVQIVLTRENFSQETSGYVNGVQQFTFTDTDGDAMVAQPGDTMRFFVDPDGAQEETAGAIARYRIFDYAMSPAGVENLDRLPDSSQPTPSPTPTTTPPKKIRYVTVRDKEGSVSPLDIRSAKLGFDYEEGDFKLSFTSWDKFGKRLLQVPKPDAGAVYMHLDTAPDKGRRRSEYAVRIYYYKGRWESRVENARGDNTEKFKIYGYGTGSHPNQKTLRWNFDGGVLDIKQRSVHFYIATGYDSKKGKCARRTCWDYSPDEGLPWGKYKLD